MLANRFDDLGHQQVGSKEVQAGLSGNLQELLAAGVSNQISFEAIKNFAAEGFFESNLVGFVESAPMSDFVNASAFEMNGFGGQNFYFA